MDLEGLLVVSLEQAVAAPLASCKLADAGARVIKIEREEGDFARRYDSLVHGQSAYFVWLNRGKESICLDIKQDKQLLLNMLKKADVFIQNLAPQAVERLGLDSETLRKANPKLITCWISGYGETGDLAHLKAYDLLVQAETGLADITGDGDARARVGVSLCDIGAGMTAHAAILQALIGRSITGKGRHISVSLFHALSDWMNVPYLQYAYGGVTPTRSGLNHPTIAPYGAFEDKFGKPLLISIQNEREWHAFCAKLLEDANIATNHLFISNVLRVKNRDALELIIKAKFKTKTREELMILCEDAKIAYGRVSSLEDLHNHPQNRFLEVETQNGMVKMLGQGALINNTPASAGKVPQLGEHTRKIRDEFALQ